MKKTILVIGLLILTSCSNEPKKVTPTETTTTIEDRAKSKDDNKKLKKEHVRQTPAVDEKTEENSMDEVEEDNSK